MATADVPSSSSSSTPNSEKYDVFLSFRGEDTRWGFTSHLYAALLRKNIKTFKDDYDLKRGDEIKPELLEAIERSKISVVIFSENYASSSWCLAELAHIITCHKNYRKVVIPVFYFIDPSHIRNQQGSFGDAFVRHEQRFNNDTRVQEWRKALCEAANLSGFDSKTSEFRNESEFVEAIVEDIWRKLKDVPLIDDFEGLIGIEGCMEKIKSLLSLDSPDTRMVGIWGMGGLGKTTLAEVVFNKLSVQFKSRCFLANVREESKNNGLHDKLLLKLVRVLLKDKSIELETKSLPDFLKERLHRTKVLVVLDDVDDSDQLDVLLGPNRDRFCKGSRIIITTRNKKVLEHVQDVKTYEVAKLNDDEAFCLVKSIAFGGNSPAPYYLELIDRVVKYAGGIPLAIKLLASKLRSIQPEGESQERILNELKQDCSGNIEKTLKISYDGLNDKEKAMFLDIACFFKGKDRDSVEGLFDGCGSARTRMKNLIDKSFITIKPSDKSIGIHDLLQDFGQKIVRQQSKERLGKYSRLCIAEDAYNVLNNNEGTEKIEGIFLSDCDYQFQEYLRLGPDVFRKMCNLRLLGIDCGVEFLNQDLQFLPHSLRYIYWPRYPSKCFPSNLVPSNLVELHLLDSKLDRLWDGVQDLDKLKCINLRGSRFLKKIPNLSGAPNLERIYLQHCSNLVKVPWFTLLSDKLIELNLKGCRNLSSTLPERIFKPSTLKTLIVTGSNVKIKALPKNISPSFVSLNLASSEIKSLPSSIGSLENLSELILNDCKSLTNIPSSIHKLKSLKCLKLAACSSLVEFSVQLPRNLETLDLSRTAIKEIHSSSFENCSGLREIYLQGCKMIESLPSSIGNLIGIEELNLENCANLESIPAGIWNLTRLKTLKLLNCKNLQLIPELPLSLNALDAGRCTSLEWVTSSTRELRQWFWARHRSHTNEVTLDLDYQNFFECLKMGQNARDVILSDFQLRVLAKARQHKLNPRDDSTVVCYPGNEIPKWFNHQSEGSSYTIPLTPQWHNAKFLGFALCIEISTCVDSFDYLKCKFNFKIRDTEEVCSFEWKVSKVPRQLVSRESVPLNSDHLFLWYQHQDYNACKDAVEVSLEFSFVDNFDSHVVSSTKEMKWYGIHMLYHDDLKDLENYYIKYDESDATHEDESSEDETTDADERHPKEIKHSN